MVYWKKRVGRCDNIRFYGFLPYIQTDIYRRSCDILLAPYQKKVALALNRGNTVRWMSPIKLFEYMAAAKPMVVSDLPVLREVLTHGVTALLCDPEDIESWIDALERLKDDPDLANRLGTAAYEEFKAKYTWRARAERIIGGLNLNS